MTSASHHDDISFTSPMECLPVKDLPDGPGWAYELNLDGYRGQATRDIVNQCLAYFKRLEPRAA